MAMTVAILFFRSSTNRVPLNRSMVHVPSSFGALQSLLAPIGRLFQLNVPQAIISPIEDRYVPTTQHFLSPCNGACLLAFYLLFCVNKCGRSGNVTEGLSRKREKQLFSWRCDAVDGKCQHFLVSLHTRPLRPGHSHPLRH